MSSGTVKWYNKDKGFGFITPEGGGNDVFVHYTAIDDGFRELVEGQRVEFEVTKSAKGIVASKVRTA